MTGLLAGDPGILFSQEFCLCPRGSGSETFMVADACEASGLVLICSNDLYLSSDSVETILMLCVTLL